MGPMAPRLYHEINAHAVHSVVSNRQTCVAANRAGMQLANRPPKFRRAQRDALRARQRLAADTLLHGASLSQLTKWRSLGKADWCRPISVRIASAPYFRDGLLAMLLLALGRQVQ